MSRTRRLNPEAPSVAYVVPHYPTVSQRFILQEVLQLRQLGVEVATFSVRRTPAEEHLTEAEREEFRTTYAILPPSVAGLLLAHLEAILRHPRRYLNTLRLALRLRRPGARGALWQLFYLAEATVVWHRCSKVGTRHVHAQFASNATDVALLAANLGGPGWTWSFALHGSAEFYDVSFFRLGHKARHADLVVCVSEFARSQVQALVEEEHWRKMYVVHLGVNGSQIARGEPPPPEDGTLQVVTVGRLVPIKGHTVLIEAIRELRSRGVRAHATIVGGGPRMQALQRIAEQLGVDDAVTFTGALGHDAVLERYKNSDCFCLPSFGEGIPVVLMEAMAMELPVVASRIMGIPELVEDGVHGLLVTPGRSDLVADAIEKLASDPALRHQMGEEGRRKVLKEFDLDSSARRLHDLFGEYAAGYHNGVPRMDSPRQEYSS